MYLKKAGYGGENITVLFLLLIPEGHFLMNNYLPAQEMWRFESGILDFLVIATHFRITEL